MADIKICDCCGVRITDLHKARMHVFYLEEQRKEFGGHFMMRQKSPEIEIDLCGGCWDKLRGFGGHDNV